MKETENWKIERLYEIAMRKELKEPVEPKELMYCERLQTEIFSLVSKYLHKILRAENSRF